MVGSVIIPALAGLYLWCMTVPMAVSVIAPAFTGLHLRCITVSEQSDGWLCTLFWSAVKRHDHCNEYCTESPAMMPVHKHCLLQVARSLPLAPLLLRSAACQSAYDFAVKCLWGRSCASCLCCEVSVKWQCPSWPGVTQGPSALCDLNGVTTSYPAPRLVTCVGCLPGRQAAEVAGTS